MARPWNADLEVAIEAALAGGAVVAAGFRTAGRHHRKGPHDVVTGADRASERQVFAILRRARARDARLGEEGGLQLSGAGGDREVSPANPDAAANAGRVWIVDPLDGTISYASGLPFFCVSVALAVDGVVVCGVVHDPFHGETVAAMRGAGAWRVPDGGACRPRRLARLGDAVVSAGVDDMKDSAGLRRLAEIGTRVRAIRTLGSIALSVTYVACGRLDGVWQPGGLTVVDVAAAGLIASEAGLRPTGADGGPWLDLADPWRSMGIAVGGPSMHRLLVPRQA